MVTPGFFQKIHPVHLSRIIKILPEVIYLKTTHNVGLQASPTVRKIYSRGLVHRFRWFRELFFSVSSIPLSIQRLILRILQGIAAAFTAPDRNRKT